MARFDHEVDERTRDASRWDEDYAAYVAPDGRYWHYTSDPRGEGVEWRELGGKPVKVAVWLKDQPA